MRTRTYAASIIAASLIQPALAASVLTDTAYDVKLQYAGEPAAQSVCITFDANGRLAIDGRRTALTWTTRPEFPDQFLAVTDPRKGEVAGNTLGLFGSVSSDNDFIASGIGRFGKRFEMSGELQRRCHLVQPANRRPDSASDPAELVDPTGVVSGTIAPCAAVNCTPHTDPLRAGAAPDLEQELINPTGVVSGTIAPCAAVSCTPHTDPLRAGAAPDVEQEMIDPTGEFAAQVAPCHSGFCDPVPDPTGAAQDRPVAMLAGQSFALTLGDSQEVNEYCWTFDANGWIRTATGTLLTWTPGNQGLRSAGFESVGISHNGRTMAYNGAMEGNLLKVTGIEARDGKPRVFEGYGQHVARCKAK